MNFTKLKEFLLGRPTKGIVSGSLRESGGPAVCPYVTNVHKSKIALTPKLFELEEVDFVTVFSHF